MEERISLAKRLFNETWDLIDNPERSDTEKAQMLHQAHASAFLWQEAGKPENNARGEWQVSHCYALLGYGEPALLHGQLSLNLCLDNGIEGLDLAFGYEAVARALKVLGRDYSEQIEKGRAACESITDAEDKQYALVEINGI